jgi:DHA1 family multidrug resistance protein-like MFS transporter
MTQLQRFVLLCVIGVCCFLSYNLVRMPVLALFAQSLGAGPAMIGLVVSISTLTGVLLKLPSGTLSDIYGRRLILRVGVLAFALPPFVYPFVSNLELLATLRAIHGLATAIFAPTALATVAEMYQQRRASPSQHAAGLGGGAGIGRGGALGWYIASTQGGALIGPVLGGWLAYMAGFGSAFTIAGIFGCLGALILYILPFPSNPHTGGRSVTQSTAELWEGLRRVARNLEVLVTSASDAAKMIANGALMAFLPIYGVAVGLNAGQVGLLFGIQGITSLLSKPVMGQVSDRVGRRPLILIGLLICAGSFGLMPRVSAFGSLLLLAACFGFGEAVVSSSSSALVADLSGSERLGAGMGMQGMIMDIGHASGPICAGLLIARMSYEGAFAVIAAIQLVAAAVFWAVVRK